MKFRRVSAQYFIDDAAQLAANAGAPPFRADNVIYADTCPADYVQCSDTDHVAILQGMLHIVTANWYAMELRNLELQKQITELLTQDLI